MCCCILVRGHYHSRNGRNNVLRGLLDLAKEIIENRDKSNVTKHLIFLIFFCQRETVFIFFLQI